MGLRDSLEAKAKKWALEKANGLLGDKNAAPPPPPPAPGTAAPVAAAPPPPVSDQLAVADAQAQVGEKVVRSIFPGLGDWADEQHQKLNQQQAAEAAKRRASIAAMPKADVTIRLTGPVEATWSGTLPVRVQVQPGTTNPEAWQAKDPFAGAQTLVVELTPQDGQRPVLGPRPMVLWRVSVPNYTGDGAYDLVALVKQRAAAGFEAPYDEVWLDLGGEEDPDWSLYFYSDAGPASVTVADGAKKITGSIAMAGAVGTVIGSLEITLPQG